MILLFNFNSIDSWQILTICVIVVMSLGLGSMVGFYVAKRKYDNFQIYNNIVDHDLTEHDDWGPDMEELADE
eukprot:Pgem_evm2s15991